MRQVEHIEPELLSESEHTVHVLRESGLLAELGPYWDKYIEAAEDVSIDQLWEMWEGQAPLSEDIIADRGER